MGILGMTYFYGVLERTSLRKQLATEVWRSTESVPQARQESECPRRRDQPMGRPRVRTGSGPGAEGG